MNNFQKSIIKQALEDPDKLTPGEWEFINSLVELAEDKELTEKQNHTLNRTGSKLA